MEIKKQISGNDQHDQQLSLDYTRCRPSTLNVGFGSSKSASREGGGDRAAPADVLQCEIVREWHHAMVLITPAFT